MKIEVNLLVKRIVRAKIMSIFEISGFFRNKFLGTTSYLLRLN